MNKDEMKIVSDLAVTALGFPASEVASLLFEIKEDETGDFKPEALKTLLDKSAVRVATFKDAETKAHDKGYNKAKAESISKFENDLKEKYGITSDKQGIELIEQVVSEKLKAQGGELDDEKIKRSPIYLNTVERLTKEKEASVKAETDKFNELQTKIQKESTFKTISEQAKAVLDELNPILPEGKTEEGKSKAEIQIARFLSQLGSEYSFEEKDGKLLVIKDGKVYEDAHGNMVPLKDIVKKHASELWDFKQGEDRTGTGNKNNTTGAAAAGNGAKKYSGPLPKNAEEYIQFISKATTLEDKQAITAHWKEVEGTTN